MMFLLSNLKEENDVTANSILLVMIDYDHLYMLCQGVTSVQNPHIRFTCLFFPTLKIFESSQESEIIISKFSGKNE